ncbi:MAG: hypothetical protein JW863_13975 [Chitinispirillaceae bacterium]|nr:hypothetical protein [Chitinispirillaceae bacterium]
MKKNRGFAVTEIILVLVILAVTAVFAKLMYRKVEASTILEKSAHRLCNDLLTAYSLAVRKNTCVNVSFNTTAGQCTLRVADSCDDPSQTNLRITVNQLSPEISFGLPDNAPAESPYPDCSASPSDLDRTMATGFVINPQSRATLTCRWIGLRSVKVSKTGYYIGFNTRLNTVELWKSNQNGSWLRL